MSEIFVRPSVEGAVIRDPVSGDLLPPGGRLVRSCPRWQLLLLRGDVVLVEPATDPAAGKEPQQPPSAKTSTPKGA